MSRLSNRLGLLSQRGLGYPAGFLPGFDSSHAASQSTKLSAIASGTTYINMLTGKSTAVSGAQTANMAFIGPSVSGAGGSSCNLFTSPFGTGTPTALTLALILIPVSSTTNVVILVGANDILEIVSLVPEWAASSTVSSGLSLVLNNPYFVAASALSGTTFNFVTLNLLTGKLQSASVSSAATLGALAATWTIGGSVGSTRVGSKIAACAVTFNYLSLTQLLAWAADPWSFWYPSPQPFDFAMASAPSGSIAYFFPWVN